MKNITILVHSLGGAILMKASEKILSTDEFKGQKFQSIINYKSFSKLSNFNSLFKILSFLYTMLEINAVKALKSALLESQDKHIFISNNDNVIPESGRMGKFHNENNSEIKNCEMSEENTDHGNIKLESIFNIINRKS